MWKWLLTVVALILPASVQAHVSAVPFPEIGSLRDVTHQAAFGIYTTYLPPASPQITCNLVTGVASVGGPCTAGTTCNGTGDDAPAFKAFNIWARANQGTTFQTALTIPAGSNCVFNSTQTGLPLSYLGVDNPWVGGINNLIVDGIGGGTALTQGTNGFWGGGVGVCERGLTDANGCTARIQTVNSGSTTVTLTAASLAAGYISRFSAGCPANCTRSIMLGGVDLQGQWATPLGKPPNQQFFEWRKVIAVNAGTGVITLDRPITNTYLDTWPNYNSGSSLQCDNGGPATIWAVGGPSDTWDASVEYRNLTISQSGQTYTLSRYVTYRNVTFTGGHGGIPSENETWAAYNASYSGVNMETDKLVGTMTMDTVTIDQLKFQSSSTGRFIMNNSTVTTSMSGTPNSATITDSSFGDLSFGAFVYGVSTGAIVCTRCNATVFTFFGGVNQKDFPSDYSMSSGVISFPNTSVIYPNLASRIFVPGGNVFWSGGSNLTVGLFNTGTITQDPTNVYVQTNEAGTYPPVSGAPRFLTHPAPVFTCDNCTGDARLVAMNTQRGATPGAPLGTYSSRDYAPTSAQGSLGAVMVVGKLTSATINVTQAYSGAGSATLQMGGQFDNFPTMKQSTWSSWVFAPKINLKQIGERIIFPGGVTCDGVPGACSGDTINSTDGYPPEAVWFGSNNTTTPTFAPYMGSTLSAGTQPLFTMTLRTNQGVVP